MIILLFLIGIIAYADRQIIALLKPVLEQNLGWSAKDYGIISSCSQIAIAFSLLVSGWIVDHLGIKKTLGIGVIGWSLTTVLHGVVSSFNSFLGLRIVLGLFEGVGTPATITAVSTWIEKDQRGSSIGLLNASPNIAAMVTPLIVAGLFPFMGWRWTIITVGFLGILCAFFWFLLPQADVPPPLPKKSEKTQENNLLKKYTRIILAFSTTKFLTDPVWWFLLFWLPDIFHRYYGLDSVQIGLPLAIVYAMAAVGSLLGGYLPFFLAKYSHQTPEIARRHVMGISALCLLPLPVIMFSHQIILGVLLAGLALAAHQAFSSNLFTFATTWLPSSCIGRAAGIGAFFGNIGGALALYLVGYFIRSATILPILGYCAIAYILGWLFLRMIAPYKKLEELHQSL
uniref:MFS transporter n=1 Tax=Zymomonas mobilis TaxID=542 RepID=UPI002090430B|nr:MFS transporter [Zymomonas mobilis]